MAGCRIGAASSAGDTVDWLGSAHGSSLESTRLRYPHGSAFGEAAQLAAEASNGLAEDICRFLNGTTAVLATPAKPFCIAAARIESEAFV